MNARQLIEVLAAAGVYYHGTDKAATGQAILRDGYLRAPGAADHDARYGQSNQRPVGGQVYLTKSLRYAVIYALGGDLMGSDHVRQSDSPSGYLFVVDGVDFNTVPDEDTLGALPAILQSLDFYARDGGQFQPLAQALKSDPALADLAQRMIRVVPEYTLRKAASGEASWQSKAGKIILRHWQGTPLMDRIGAHCSNVGAAAERIPWREAWEIAKADGKLLQKDAANFFQIARRIA